MAHSEYCQMPRMELYEKAVSYFCKCIRLNVLQGSEYISTKDIELIYVPCQCLFTIIITFYFPRKHRNVGGKYPLPIFNTLAHHF